MIDLLAFLKANSFSSCIASGGGRDFMRPISRACTASRESMGSAAAQHSLIPATSRAGGTITHKPEVDYLDDGPEKPIRIWNRVGHCPVFAAGNSDGDIPMLDFSQHADKPTLRLRPSATTTTSESSITPTVPSAHERTSAHEQADKHGWTLVSVKNDWRGVF